jgi:glycosyltransferase involved in cell wall biosynthesis
VKKVLIITYYWPPSGGAGVQRWLKFTRYLPGFGWQPVVYAPENPEAPVDDLSLMEDIHPDVKVIKKRIREPYSMYRRFLGMSPDDRINAGFLTEKEKPQKKEGISVWIRGNLFIPDARKFWIRPSVRFLKTYIRQNPVDAIISSGPPHSMHLIALKLKKHVGLPWIADFRDPWTEIDFYDRLRLTRWADKKHRTLEHMVLTGADRVVVIGKTMAKRFGEMSGIEPVVIPNGYDEADFTVPPPGQPVSGEASDHPEAADRFTILHVGAMNGDRNHPVFWKAISSLISEHGEFASRIRLRFIGKLDYSVIDSIRDAGLGDITLTETYLSHNRIPQALRSASILYLPINRTPGAGMIQTGKIFEYLASGRPVLGTGPVDGDAAEILAESSGGTMVGFEDEEGLKKALLDYFTRFLNHNLPTTRPPRQYSRKNLAGKLVQVMNDLANSPN